MLVNGKIRTVMYRRIIPNRSNTFTEFLHEVDKAAHASKVGKSRRKNDAGPRRYDREPGQEVAGHFPAEPKRAAITWWTPKAFNAKTLEDRFLQLKVGGYGMPTKDPKDTEKSAGEGDEDWLYMTEDAFEMTYGEGIRKRYIIPDVELVKEV